MPSRSGKTYGNRRRRCLLKGLKAIGRSSRRDRSSTHATPTRRRPTSHPLPLPTPATASRAPKNAAVPATSARAAPKCARGDTTSGPGPPSLPRDGDCLGGDVGREPVSTARTAGHHHPADCDHGSGNRFLPSRRRATERPTHNHKSQAALNVLAEFFESRQMLMREDFLRILRQSQTTEPRMKIQTSES